MKPVLHPPDLGLVPDVRLVAVDLDGSLLDDEKRVGPGFEPLLDELVARGITVCPASGRQYATLRHDFGRDDLLYIAENGAIVVRDGQVVATDGPSLDVARRYLRHVRRFVAGGADLGAVLCGRSSAYIERTDEAFLAKARPYYKRLTLVDDLLAVDDEVLKLAVYDFGSAETGAGPALAALEAGARVVVSGHHWVDVGSPTADKGSALRVVQRSLGIDASHTMVFGDYLNDLGMLAAAQWSFAMDNAHPAVRAAARFVAPSNNANGVVRTLAATLGIRLPTPLTRRP